MRNWVISLLRAEERQNWVKSHLDFTFDFFWAVDGKKFRLSHPVLNPEAVSTFITHTTLWLQLKNLSDDNFLILEDDVEMIGDYSNIEQKLETIPENWDIAFVGWYNTNFFGRPTQVNKDWVFIPKFWGMHSYIIRKSSIDKIYKSLVNIDNHIDIQLSRLILEGRIKAYFLKEPIFKQGSQFPS